ncbi:MAG TPA: hypothetical protein VEJ87_16935 [Acidimicrobiales bacterium]|nr:hypothetical protein [Acidimicrobiales bacterium]
MNPTVTITGVLHHCVSTPNVIAFGTLSLTSTVALPDNNCNARLVPNGTAPPMVGSIAWTGKHGVLINPSLNLSLPVGTYTSATSTLAWTGGSIGGGSFMGGGDYLNPLVLRPSSAALVAHCNRTGTLAAARWSGPFG